LRTLGHCCIHNISPGDVLKPIALAAALAWGGVTSALAQGAAETWPSRPVKIVVPYAAGGTADNVARLFAERLAAKFKQPFIVDNKPGAGGTLGTAVVAKSPADGYTLLLTTSSPLVINPLIDKTVTYNVDKDLAPVAMLTHMSLLLVSSPSLPAKNLKELIAYVKQNPGKLSYASNGYGSYSHMSMEMFKRAIGADLAHVPYKSAVQAEIDVIGGRVTMMFDSITTGAELVKRGRLRAFGVSSKSADPIVPQQQPLAQQGVPALKDFDVSAWSGLLAPRATPPAAVTALTQAVREMVADPDFRELMLAHSHVLADPAAVAGMSKVIETDRVKWGQLVKATGISLD